jgi:hypothetical protein
MLSFYQENRAKETVHTMDIKMAAWRGVASTNKKSPFQAIFCFPALLYLLCL